MFTERHVVDNRVFLLALDQLYREAIKPLSAKSSSAVRDTWHPRPASLLLRCRSRGITRTTRS
jgi:hypothetical protein